MLNAPRALHQNQLGEHAQLVELQERHSRNHPDDLQLWYQLAEAYGLTQDIKGVHLARAEYFLLKGAVPKALEHLKLALKQPDLSHHERLLTEHRIKDAKQIQKQMKF